MSHPDAIPNEDLAKMLLDKINDAITEICVSNSFTLAAAAQLLVRDPQLYVRQRVAAWQFIEKIHEARHG